MVTSSSAAFITHNASSRREPRHVAVGYFDAETWYFTSHDDIVTPDSTKTYYGVIKNMPVESQAIDPVFFKYTMGVGAIEFVDLDDGVTNFLATKFAADVTARKKKIEFYTGFRGMEFADFDLIATQIIDNQIAVSDDNYKLDTADLQRTLRSKIFSEVKTTLSGNVNDTQTYVLVNDPSDFETVVHDANFSHLPSTTVGYLSIVSNKQREKIAWLNKLDTAVQVSGTDISFSTSDDSINSTSTDLSGYAVGQAIEIQNSSNNNVVVTGSDISFSSTDNSISSGASAFGSFSVGQIIDITGSTSNNGAFTVVSVTAAKLVVSESITTESAGSSITIKSRSIFVIATVSTNKLTLTENIVDESAGATIVLTANPQFYNCTRGVLNTRAINHTVDLTASIDRRTAVTMWRYYETTALKLAYGFLAGVWYGTSDALPSTDHLGIDTSLIEGSQFIAHPDLWKTSDDSGFKLRFEGETEQDAQKFIYEQVLFPIGCFERILNNGKIGVKRYSRVISGAAAVGHITQSDIVGNVTINYALKDVVNLFKIAWNWDPDTKKYTRTSPVLDLNSTAKYGSGDARINYGLRGVHGSIHTYPIVFGIADMIRDRYASYPKRITLRALPGHSRYEPGDIIRVTADKVKDHTNSNTKRLDSAFEVQQKQYDPNTGQAIYTLFGSSEAAKAMAHYTGTELPDSYYSSEGTNINTVLTGTSSGGTFTVTANGTLTGNADITNSGAIYYCTENLTFASGVEITYTQNIQLRVLGQFTNNGKLNGKGQGLSGATGYTLMTEKVRDRMAYAYEGNQGNAGFIGNTEAAGGWIYIKKPQITEGKYDTAPYLPIVNTGSTLTGIPTDLRGTSGGSGDPINVTPVSGGNYTLGASGGAGGSGGAGLLIVARGMVFGADGQIDCSGNEGSLGGSATINWYNSATFNGFAGTGAPGHPGAVYVFLDGAASNYPDNNVVADIVQPQIQGVPWVLDGDGELPVEYTNDYYSPYQGTPTTDAKLSVFRVQYVPRSEAAELDVSSIANPAQSITVSEASAGDSSPNLVNLRISATPPAPAGSYDYSKVYIRESGQTGYTYIGDSANSDDYVIYPGLPGTTYDIKANPVSVKGAESAESTSTTHSINNRLEYKTTPSFGENTLYFDTSFEALDSWTVSTNTALNAASGGIRITKDTTSGIENTYKVLGLSYGTRQMSLGNHVRFQALLGTVTVNAQSRTYIATGSIGARAFGFRYSGTAWEGFTDNGTSTYTTLSASPASGKFVEVEFVPSGSLSGTVYFYVDGVQVGSQSVTWGVDTGSEYVANFWVEHAATAGSNSVLDIITYRYMQKF